MLDGSSQTETDSEAALIQRFAAAVRTFARRRLRTADAVDEFAQEVFLRLVQAVRAGQIDDPARIAGFVLGICRNLARERARIADRRGALWELYGASLAALDDPPEVDGHRVALLEDCLTQLAHRSREVLRRAYVDGASAAEIAGRLAMTEGNVRVVRHRSLEALRACMSAKIFYEEVS